MKAAAVGDASGFSLAGVQMKFSMRERDGRYNLATRGELGGWIIKTPSTRHPFVPLNEFTAMSLAAIAGVEIPEIKLVELEKLPPINFPNEKWALAIKRYDRNGDQRIHAEDFAQVLVEYAHDKYGSANYERIGRVIYRYSGDGLVPCAISRWRSHRRRSCASTGASFKGISGFHRRRSDRCHGA